MTKRLLIVATLLLAACTGTGKQQVGSEVSSGDMAVPFDVVASEDGAAVEDLAGVEDALVPEEDVPQLEDVSQEETAADVVEPEDIVADAPLEDTFELPKNCCFSEADCQPGTVCIGYDGGPWPEAGSCEPAPQEGQCWGGDDCMNNSEWCAGAVICGCGEKCAKQPGTCTPYESSCCVDDSECDEGAQCIPGSMGENPGMCKEQPSLGQCWHDQHCKPGQLCQGAFVCPCDFDCAEADSTGQCVYPCGDDDCCCVDEDCGGGNVCVILENGNNCLPAQMEGMCWQDSDCVPNEFCHGAIACPCDWDCDGDGWDIPGTCKQTGGDMCCMTDADCPQFYMGKPMVCLIEDGNPFVVGTCQPAAPAGKCWGEQDCASGQVCKGMYFCPCGMDCEAPGTALGDCFSPESVDPACVPNGQQCGAVTGTAWLVFPDPWFGDEPGPDEQPLPEVTVEALKDGQVVATDTTDAQGVYLLTLSPGDYIIKASHNVVNEWETVFPATIEKSIGLFPGEVASVDFEFYWEGNTVDKPNIYLYPESTQQVSVTLQFKGNMLVKSIPEYGDGWNVTATPEGLIDGQYGYLFYEATAGGAGFQTDSGFVVSQSDLAVWMEDTLAAYGFNEQEIVDFVDFWVPVLPSASWYIFFPQTEEVVDLHVGLQVEPAPDSLLRIWFAVQPTAAPVSLPAPQILPFDRVGFAVTEWGVIVLD